MNIELFLLLIMHIIGDFYLQGRKVSICKVGKLEKDCFNYKKCVKKNT